MTNNRLKDNAYPHKLTFTTMGGYKHVHHKYLYKEEMFLICNQLKLSFTPSFTTLRKMKRK